MDLNLLPCPFCGTEPEATHIGNDHTKSQKIRVRCPECRVERIDAFLNKRYMGMDWLKDVAEKNWNQRPKQ